MINKSLLSLAILFIAINSIYAQKSLIKDGIIVGYYGHINSTRMGILGENSIDITAKKLNNQAKEYEKYTDKKVYRAFHIIFATVYPNADVGMINKDKLIKYIEYAQKNDMLVILDHQLGKYSIPACIKTMLPWLKYPNVHLAIDPEWSTLKPGKQIGVVTAYEVNQGQKLIQEYLEENNLKDIKRILIVHQFNASMITNRSTVKNDYSLIDLIHNSDGFGGPKIKIDTWNYNKKAINMPNKGFKLFYAKPWKSRGYDKPIMTPKQVLELDPSPLYINYQ